MEARYLTCSSLLGGFVLAAPPGTEGMPATRTRTHLQDPGHGSTGSFTFLCPLEITYCPLYHSHIPGVATRTIHITRQWGELQISVCKLNSIGSIFRMFLSGWSVCCAVSGHPWSIQFHLAFWKLPLSWAQGPHIPATIRYTTMATIPFVPHCAKNPSYFRFSPQDNIFFQNHKPHCVISTC